MNSSSLVAIVVLDISEDLSIMGLKDVDTVDSDIWGRMMNFCRLVGVDVRFVTYILGCEQWMRSAKDVAWSAEDCVHADQVANSTLTLRIWCWHYVRTVHS